MMVNNNDEEKLRPITRKVHPAFWELVDYIQNEKIVQGINTSLNKTSKHMITKQIANMFGANPKIMKALIQVTENTNGTKL